MAQPGICWGVSARRCGSCSRLGKGGVRTSAPAGHARSLPRSRLRHYCKVAAPGLHKALRRTGYAGRCLYSPGDPATTLVTWASAKTF
jgi:hypothetical protein